MKCARADELLTRYRDGLLHDTLPFWLHYGMDARHGGLLTSLGRGGECIDTDKPIWAQGRFAWLLSTLYSTVEPRDEWLDAALNCARFLGDHAADDDGRMYFLVAQDGRPLRKRRYAFSEAFASMAFAACSRATGNDILARRAKDLFAQYIRIALRPGGSDPKVIQSTRSSKSIGPLMIGINVAQTLRDTLGFTSADNQIDKWIEEIERDFCKPEFGAVMETVTPSGDLLDHFDGRLLNPGHAIEAAWFILKEADGRDSDPRLVKLGVRILDWMWERGWDEEHGGLYSFRDVRGRPVQTVEHEMKYWWPHNEACIATLYAAVLTGDARHLERHELVSDWAHEHFADPEHGEWLGYLQRDGTPVTTLKGNHWKGAFHVPRMQLLCWQLLERLTAEPHGEGVTSRPG